MKRKQLIAALTTGALLAAALSGCGGQEAQQEEPQDLLDKIQTAGVLVVGTEGTYTPNSYHDDSGELVGFDVEVAKAIADELGVEAQFVEAEWDSLFASMDAGRVDTVINEVEYSDERAEKYDFSQPYTYVHGALLVAEDNDTIHSFDDLEGAKASQNLTSSWGTLAVSYGAELVGVDSIAQSIDLLLTGRADATLNSETAFGAYLNAHPEAAVKVAATTDSTSSSRVPVPKGNEKLLEAIDQALDNLRASGKLSELSLKYFGTDVTDQ